MTISIVVCCKIRSCFPIAMNQYWGGAQIRADMTVRNAYHKTSLAQSANVENHMGHFAAYKHQP